VEVEWRKKREAERLSRIGGASALFTESQVFLLQGFVSSFAEQAGDAEFLREAGVPQGE